MDQIVQAGTVQTGLDLGPDAQVVEELATAPDDLLRPLREAIEQETVRLGDHFSALGMEQAQELWGRWGVLKDLWGELTTAMEDLMVQWLDANGRLQIGATRWLYPGVSKKQVCDDPGGLLLALVKQYKQKPTEVAGCLSSDPWKTTPLREILGDQWGMWFEERLTKPRPTKGGQKAADNAEALRRRPMVADDRFRKRGPAVPQQQEPDDGSDDSKRERQETGRG